MKCQMNMKNYNYVPDKHNVVSIKIYLLLVKQSSNKTLIMPQKIYSRLNLHLDADYTYAKIQGTWKTSGVSFSRAQMSS